MSKDQQSLGDAKATEKESPPRNDSTPTKVFTCMKCLFPAALAAIVCTMSALLIPLHSIITISIASVMLGIMFPLITLAFLDILSYYVLLGNRSNAKVNEGQFFSTKTNFIALICSSGIGIALALMAFLLSSPLTVIILPIASTIMVQLGIIVTLWFPLTSLTYAVLSHFSSLSNHHTVLHFISIAISLGVATIVCILMHLSFSFPLAIGICLGCIASFLFYACYYGAHREQIESQCGASSPQDGKN
jgi:hypothetical protein